MRALDVVVIVLIVACLFVPLAIRFLRTRRRDRPTVVEALTIFVLGVAAIIGYLQWRTLDKTDETMRAPQRAFVTVNSFDTPIRYGTGFAKDTKYWWFIPSIKNSGNTPTKNMRYFVIATCPPELDIAMGAHMSLDCNFMGAPQAADPEEVIKKKSFKGKAAAALLGPQSASSLGGLGMTQKSVEAVVDGYPIFLSGIVFYNDSFPDTSQHVTKFCYQLTATLSEKKEIVPGYNFCPHWNCADDECVADRKEYDRQVAAGEIIPPPKPPDDVKHFSNDPAAQPPAAH